MLKRFLLGLGVMLTMVAPAMATQLTIKVVNLKAHNVLQLQGASVNPQGALSPNAFSKKQLGFLQSTRGTINNSEQNFTFQLSYHLLANSQHAQQACALVLHHVAGTPLNIVSNDNPPTNNLCHNAVNDLQVTNNTITWTLK